MADDYQQTREGRSLALVRESLGDLYIAATYPGGARAMHRELLTAENRLDRMLERAALAKAVLSGEADEYVEAWQRRTYETDDALCDHCRDLSARLLRAARDRAVADFDRERGEHNALLAVVRRALHALVRPDEMYDSEALRRRLCQFFGLMT